MAENNDQLLLIQQLMRQSKAFQLDARPGFDERIIARFEFLEPKKSFWQRWLLTFFIGAPVLSIASYYFAQQIKTGGPFLSKLPAQEQSEPAKMNPDSSLPSVKPSHSSEISTPSKDAKNSEKPPNFEIVSEGLSQISVSVEEGDSTTGKPWRFPVALSSQVIKVKAGLSRVVLVWSECPPSDQYRCPTAIWLERREKSDFNKISAVSATQKQTTDSPNPGTWAYRIASSLGGKIVYSNTTQVTIEKPVPEPTRSSSRSDGEDAQNNHGPFDFRTVWSDHAGESVANLTWSLDPNEPIAAVLVERSENDQSHWTAVAHLPSTALHYEWSGNMRPDTSMYFRITAVYEGDSSPISSPVSELKSQALPGPILNSVTYHGKTFTLDFKWTPPTGLSAKDSTSVVIEANFNQGGYYTIAKIPANLGTYSLPWPLGQWEQVCKQTQYGCGSQTYRIHLEGSGGSVSPISALSICPLDANNNHVYNDSDDIQKFKDAIKTPPGDISPYDVNHDGVLSNDDTQLIALLRGASATNPVPFPCKNENH